MNMFFSYINCDCVALFSIKLGLIFERHASPSMPQGVHVTDKTHTIVNQLEEKSLEKILCQQDTKDRIWQIIKTSHWNLINISGNSTLSE
jgi:hypothetical protein